MSVETTERVMRDYLDRLLNRGDFEQCFVEDVLWTTMETGEQVRGRRAVRDYIVGFHTQVFDASPDVKNLVASDGAAVLEADFVGTHVGEFAGLSGTGAKLRVPYCVVYDVGEDGIIALRAYLPIADMIARLRAAA